MILPKNSGRDRTGQISTRHRGGRQKRFFRLIDFKRDKRDMTAEVIGIEYDPNRTANIALLQYEDGARRYITHPQGLSIGDKVISSDSAPLKFGNAMKLSQIPVGTEIHNVELYPGRGAMLAKTAGSFAVILAKGSGFVDIKLPSREVRRLSELAIATIGRVSFAQHKLIKLKRAGQSRHAGWRPTVRGVAQHPGAHPHGGGEGRSGQGMNPKTKWGRPAFGKKTRKKGWSNKFIIVKRKP